MALQANVWLIRHTTKQTTRKKALEQNMQPLPWGNAVDHCCASLALCQCMSTDALLMYRSPAVDLHIASQSAYMLCRNGKQGVYYVVIISPLWPTLVPVDISRDEMRAIVHKIPCQIDVSLAGSDGHTICLIYTNGVSCPSERLVPISIMANDHEDGQAACHSGPSVVRAHQSDHCLSGWSQALTVVSSCQE